MGKQYLNYLLLSFLFSFSIYAQAQEVPGITSYTRSEYDAAHQNWMITQDCNNYLFVANSDGVLVFNGKLWQLIPMPNNHTPRSVFLGKDCKVYTSGFEFFGYIDMSNRMYPKFEPVSRGILNGTNQEIWNIFGENDEIFFQSFSELYQYDYEEINRIDLPTNVMLGNAVMDRPYIPKIEQGLYKIEKDVLVELEAAKLLPKRSKIASLCSGHEEDDLILATQIHGLFILKNNRVVPLESEFNEQLKREQINKIIRMTNGDYVIGTILNGVYISSDLETVKFHINKSHGLLNNTVLSLYEDHLQHLWVGLDKGICRINTNENNSFYYDNTGQLGTIFTYIEYEGAIYLGTNQGVFKKNRTGAFELVENSQGQIWSFLIADGDLLCGHNSGTYQIIEDRAILISDVTGGWDMTQIAPNRVLQSSYTGFVTLIKDNGEWQLEQRLTNGELQSRQFALNGRHAVCFHPFYGLKSIEFSSDFKTLISQVDIATNDSINLSAEFYFLKSNEEIIFSLNDIKYSFNHQELSLLNESDELRISADSNYVTRVGYFQNLKKLKDKQLGPSPLSFHPDHIGSKFIYGIDNGYAMVPKYSDANDSISFPEIDFITIDNKIQPFEEGKLTIPSQANEVKFYLKNLSFEDKNINFTSTLDGYREERVALAEDGVIDYFSLDNGEYILKISDDNPKNQKEIAKIIVNPHWYESWKGFLLYLFLIGIALFIINIYQKGKYIKQRKKIEENKNKELESERIKAKNDKLERELKYKSKMLANSAMTLVQKNKMLNNLKELIRNEKDKVESGFLIQKVTRLINRNLNSDKDWEIFEQNFAEVHQDFLDKLKVICKDITSGELKLAAYIRMNLSSKEIAPLLNISVRSVENKRYRLRKKLNVGGESNLKDYLSRL